MTVSTGFAPICGADAKVLILGSLPGQKSLHEQQYYAHPRNAFWPIMAELYDVRGDYRQRCRGLVDNGIALWDVLHASERPGSLDSDIKTNTAQPNDFAQFLRRNNQIELIVFNGKTSEQLFRRLVPRESYGGIRCEGAPSTSPAYAAMSYAKKRQKWQALLQTVAH